MMLSRPKTPEEWAKYHEAVRKARQPIHDALKPEYSTTDYLLLIGFILWILYAVVIVLTIELGS